jgi:hypothetical protein
MKILTTIALICSTFCIVISLIQHDYTEAVAWFCLLLHESKDLIFNK